MGRSSSAAAISEQRAAASQRRASEQQPRRAARSLQPASSEQPVAGSSSGSGGGSSSSGNGSSSSGNGSREGGSGNGGQCFPPPLLLAAAFFSSTRAKSARGSRKLAARHHFFLLLRRPEQLAAAGSSFTAWLRQTKRRGVALRGGAADFRSALRPDVRVTCELGAPESRAAAASAWLPLPAAALQAGAHTFTPKSLHRSRSRADSHRRATERAAPPRGGVRDRVRLVWCYRSVSVTRSFRVECETTRP